ncbi:MAG TPA: hypothetical protein VGE52_18385 [Pirellulales bacterium]
MLTVPRLLDELIALGRWPRNSTEAMAQNLKSLASKERIEALAPEEERLYLLPPPFYTVRQQIAGNSFWCSEMAAPHEIDFDLALDIGDFGLGSDAPILLDYRLDPANPRVIRLRWSGGGKPNDWVVMAPDFASFVSALGL